MLILIGLLWTIFLPWLFGAILLRFLPLRFSLLEMVAASIPVGFLLFTNVAFLYAHIFSISWISLILTTFSLTVVALFFRRSSHRGTSWSDVNDARLSKNNIIALGLCILYLIYATSHFFYLEHEQFLVGG